MLRAIGELRALGGGGGPGPKQVLSHSITFSATCRQDSVPPGCTHARAGRPGSDPVFFSFQVGSTHPGDSELITFHGIHSFFTVGFSFSLLSTFEEARLQVPSARHFQRRWRCDWVPGWQLSQGRGGSPLFGFVKHLSILPGAETGEFSALPASQALRMCEVRAIIKN